MLIKNNKIFGKKSFSAMNGVSKMFLKFFIGFVNMGDFLQQGISISALQESFS